MASSTLNNTLNWSAYQDKQLKVLIALEKSFNSSLNMSKSIEGNLSRLQNSMASLAQAATNIATYVAGLPNSGGRGRRNNNYNQQVFNQITRSLNNLHSAEIQRIEDEHRVAQQYLEEQVLAARQELEDRTAAKKTQEEINKMVVDVLDRASSIVTTLGKSADSYAEISNNLLKITGETGVSVRNFREDIVNSITEDLNSSTGNYYNAQEVYKNMVAIASQANIGNLSVLKEITRPIMLAQESMNVSVESLSTLLSKWHTRYSFSSMTMESIIDEIRGNTAGNQANEEDIIKYLSLMTPEIMLRYQGSEQEEALKSISNVAAWLGNMNFDASNLMQNAYDILSGAQPTSTLNNILSRGGLNWTKAQDLLRNGGGEGFEEYSMSYMRGLADAYGDVVNGRLTQTALEAQGISYEDARDAYDVLQKIAEGVYEPFDEFLTNNSTRSAEDVVDDKYLSYSDQLRNTWMEKIYQKIAQLQEQLGFGLSDLAGLYVLARGILGLSKVGGVLKGGLSSILGGSSGGAVLGGLGSVGALAAGGATAGLGFGIDGIAGMFNSNADSISRSLSMIEATAGITGGAGLLGIGVATGPVGWIALGVAGVAMLGKAAYNNAKELSGNAKVVKSAFDQIRSSLKEENTTRLKDLASLQEAVEKTDSLEERKRLVEEAGIINTEQLSEMNEEALNDLIESYTEAAKKMNGVTDSIITARGQEVSSQQDIQQKALIESITSQVKSGALTGSDLESTLAILMSGVTDEGLLSTWQKYQKDNKITKSEALDLLYGGKNAWFDHTNLTDVGIDVQAMQMADILGNFTGQDYSIFDQTKEKVMASLYAGVYNAMLAGNAADPAIKALRDSEYLSDMKNSSYYSTGLKKIADALGIPAFAEGTNYVTSDQLAMLHEGEAVVPKKYNPVANINELERLREQTRQNQQASTEENMQILEYLKGSSEIMQDIKEFLSYWRNDNIRREAIKESKSKYSSSALRTYLTT